MYLVGDALLGNGLTGDIRGLVTGGIVLGMSIVALPVMFRLFSWALPASIGSGTGGAAAAAAPRGRSRCRGQGAPPSARSD